MACGVRGTGLGRRPPPGGRSSPPRRPGPCGVCSPSRAVTECGDFAVLLLEWLLESGVLLLGCWFCLLQAASLQPALLLFGPWVLPL